MEQPVEERKQLEVHDSAKWYIWLRGPDSAGHHG